MRGKKLNGYAAAGAVLLIIASIIGIASYNLRMRGLYMAGIFAQILGQICIAHVGILGLLIIGVGRLAKSKVMMLIGCGAYALKNIIYTYDCLMAMQYSDNRRLMLLQVGIDVFALATAIILFVFILNYGKMKNIRYIWYIPAICIGISSIFTLCYYGQVYPRMFWVLKNEIGDILAAILNILGIIFICLDIVKAIYPERQKTVYSGQAYRMQPQQTVPGATGQYVQNMAGSYAQPQCRQGQNNPQFQYQQMTGNMQQQKNTSQVMNQQMAGNVQPQYQQMRNNMQNQNIQMQTTAGNGEHKLSLEEELKKYKELADDGVITMQEYEEKKKKLLGL